MNILYDYIYKMFNCPLCRNETIFIAKLCEKCDRIRHIVSIYSIDEVLGVLEDKLVVKSNEYKITIGNDVAMDVGGNVVECKDVDIKPKTIQIDSNYCLRSKDKN
jgi:hypothetical protein